MFNLLSHLLRTREIKRMSLCCFGVSGILSGEPVSRSCRALWAEWRHRSRLKCIRVLLPLHLSQKWASHWKSLDAASLRTQHCAQALTVSEHLQRVRESVHQMNNCTNWQHAVVEQVESKQERRDNGDGAPSNLFLSFKFSSLKGENHHSPLYKRIRQCYAVLQELLCLLLQCQVPLAWQ